MRKTQKNDSDLVLNITELIILKNFWEYFITDESYSDDIKTALVMGQEVELGDVSLSEIRPYIMTRTAKRGPRLYLSL